MEDLREKIPMLLAIVVSVTICVLAYYFLEYHEAIYYTQIDNSKVEQVSSSDEMKYQYTLDCYDENGKKKEISFKTSRQLRQDAYLQLEVKSIGVHSWKEVQYGELPEKVKGKFEVLQKE